jgi:hypothetical protein
MNKVAFIEAIAAELGSSLLDGTYQFQIRRKDDLFLNGRGKSDFGYICQNLILRKIYYNIKRIYSVGQSDRNTIVRQMKILLNENVNMWVVRLDVKHFYESIDRCRILKKLEEDARLSYQTISLLQCLFSNPVVVAESGLPRGLGISAAMSELYMKYFDLEMKRVEGVYYYARYVDDVIVFCSTEQSANKVWECAKDGLGRLGLEMNEEKSYKWNPYQDVGNLTYLGYTFRKDGKRLIVSIAEKKQKVIKTRLVKSFVRFAKDRDFELLKMRIKFLTGNFSLFQADTLMPIKVGIYFNYKLATNIDSLDELDRFYQRLLHCRNGKLGSKVNLSKSDLKAIEKYSFRFGYKNHVNHHFTIDQMTKITNCWR